MFQKLKQFRDLRNQAKNLKNILSQHSVSVERNGISLKMDGNQKILLLKIQDNTSIHDIEHYLPGIIEEVTQSIQKKMAEVAQGLGGFENFLKS